LLAGALLLSSLFEFSGRPEEMFQETTGKFLGKEPWQPNFRQGSLAGKFKFTPSATTWFSNTFAIWKLFENIVLESILTSCFSYDISLHARFIAARNLVLRKMLLCHFSSKRWCEQALLQ
jgi:hypothetical protein